MASWWFYCDQHGAGVETSRDLCSPFRMIHQGIIRLESLVTHTSTMDDHPALIQRLLDGDSSYIKGVVTLD